MKYNHYMAIAFSACLLTACLQDDFTGAEDQGTITFAPTVQSMVQVDTRTIGNEFFTKGNKISVTIKSSQSSATEKEYTYSYADGIFSGNYIFSLDNSYISTLTAKWPVGNLRRSGIQTDQRKLENYRQADWLEATASISGIMPTDAPVPLTFAHENCRLVFELAGQNANGLNIESLILELQYDPTGGSNTQSTAFWAYCGNENGNAELILDPKIVIKSSSQYMIGRIKVGGNKPYTGTIFFPATNVTLEAGYSYLVTLTPRGDDLIASIDFGGWGQDEEGIGVPFQKPTQIDGTDWYEIKNATQLITLSYLIRNYPVPDHINQDGINWRNQKYKITQSLTMPQDVEWVSIDKSLFSGEITLENGSTIKWAKDSDKLYINE